MGTVVSVSHCHIHIFTMQQIVVLLTVFVFSSHATNNGAPESNKARNPKLFFVSTSQSTSTLSTLTFCYSTVGTPTVCGKRKRSLLDETFQEDESIQKISPSMPEVDSSIDEYQAKDLDREGKYLLYWITTTSTSTSTTFTATSTLVVTSCTPATGFPVCK